MQQRGDPVLITHERFIQLVNIERACGDFVTMLIDLNQPETKLPALAGVEVSSPVIKGIVLTALAEAAKSLNLNVKLST